MLPRITKMTRISLNIVKIHLIIATFFQGSIGDEHEYRLTKYLLSNYDSSVRPVANSSEPIRVIFSMSLYHIIDVDEKNQILTLNCWLTQTWNDTHLTWNASDFGGITHINLPFNKVWLPDIILYNNADSGYNAAVINTNVMVESSGLVNWLSHGIYKSSCKVNVEYFPFDVQVCEMKWASWTYDADGLDVFFANAAGDLSNYQENGEFKLESVKPQKHCVFYSCCPSPFPDVTYKIKLRRRPMFYVFNLILPCVLINGIALLVFYVPSESGEKVTLGISALLSMTVFLMTIRESLPPTEKTPLISLYYGVSICLVSFASAMAVVTLNIHHRGLRGSRVPPWVRKIILGYLAKIVLLSMDEEEQAKNRQEKCNTLVMEASQNNTRLLTVNTSSPMGEQDYQINNMEPVSTIDPNNEDCNNGLHHTNGGHSTASKDMMRPLQPELLIGGNHQSLCCFHHLNHTNHVNMATSSSDELHEVNSSMRRRRRNPRPESVSSSHCNGPVDQFQPTSNHIHHNTTSSLNNPRISTIGVDPSSMDSAILGSVLESNNKILLRLSNSIDKLEKRFVDTDSDSIASLEWKKVSLVVDRVLLLLFFLAMSISSIAVLTSSPHIFTESESDLRHQEQAALSSSSSNNDTDSLSSSENNSTAFFYHGSPCTTAG